METIDKTDLKQLEKQVEVIDLQIEEIDKKMEDATVGDYLELRRRLNELAIKREAIIDTISRLSDRKFSKNVPERSITISTVTINRYAK